MEMETYEKKQKVLKEMNHWFSAISYVWVEKRRRLIFCKKCGGVCHKIILSLLECRWKSFLYLNCYCTRDIYAQDFEFIYNYEELAREWIEGYMDTLITREDVRDFFSQF